MASAAFHQVNRNKMASAFHQVNRNKMASASHQVNLHRYGTSPRRTQIICGSGHRAIRRRSHRHRPGATGIVGHRRMRSGN